MADETLLDIFLNQVYKNPKNIALIIGNTSYTYSELDSLSDNLTRKISANNSEFVVTLLPQGVEFILATLAAFKLGKILAPLSIEYPKDRLNFMLTDLSFPVVITTIQSAQFFNLNHKDYYIINVAELSLIDSEGKLETPKIQMRPKTPQGSDVAYIFYTSGSTGEPKGVMLTHSGLVHDVIWVKNRFEMTPLDRSILFLNPAFSFTTEEIWPCIECGGTLVIPPPELRSDMSGLRDWMNSVNVTICTFPAPLAEKFYSLTPSRSNTLRWLNCGSGTLTIPIPSVLPYGFSYCYGSTEALRITEVRVRLPNVAPSHQDSYTVVGKPIPNVNVFILDDSLLPVSACDVGEIYVGGVHVTRGYFNKSELTSQKYISNPFGKGTLYRTGDFGRRLENDCIQLEGRQDDQVKVNGHRVELGEIRQLLQEYSANFQNVIVLAEKIEQETKIHAFCVWQKKFQGNWDSRDAFKFLQNHLPYYSLPATINVLNELPLNANGKLDRVKLLTLKKFGNNENFVPLSSPCEKMLASIWSEILSIDLSTISRDDNFFQLGGSSMTASKLLGILQSPPHNYANLQMFHILSSPSLNFLAKILSDNQLKSDLSVRVPCYMDFAKNNQELPLSWQQEQIWFYSQQINYPGLYLKISAIKFIAGEIETIKSSIAVVLKRHPSLVVDIYERNGAALQRPKSSHLYQLEMIDISNSEIRESELFDYEQVSQAVQNKMQDSKAQLLSFLAVTTKTDIFLLIFSHHLVIDGVGIRLLHGELRDTYNSRPLAPIAQNYFDYVLEQRFGEDISEAEQSEIFWKCNLTGISPLPLPTDFPRASARSIKQSGIYRFKFPMELSYRIKKFATQNSTTTFVTLLGAFKTLLYRYTGQSDIFILVPIDGRNRSRLKGVIGHFVNMVIVRTQLDGSLNFAQFVETMRKSFNESYKHQNLPLQKVIEICGFAKDEVGLLRVCVGMEPKLDTESTFEESARYNLAPNLGTTIFETFLNFEDFEDGSLGGMIEYDQNLYTLRKIQNLVTHLSNLLDAGIANSHTPLDKLELMSPAERFQVSVDFGKLGNPIIAEPGETLVSMFSSQVKTNPDRIAIEDISRKLSYAALDKASNDVAYHLMPESKYVAVLLPPCSDLVIATLAILKVGKAVVPIDIKQSEKRILQILENLNSPILITCSEYLGTLKYSNTFYVDNFAKPVRRSTTEFANPPQHSLSYVLHTSGSTGVPKAVQDMNDGLVNVIKWFKLKLCINEKDRQLLFTSPAFDGSIAEIWPTLTSGGTLVTCPSHLRANVNGLRDFIQTARITRCNVTTVVAETLYGVDVNNFQNTALVSIVCGGERMRQLPSKDVPFSVYNVYGVTEASVWSTFIDVVQYQSAADEFDQSVIPIGRPIDGVEVFVMDKNMELLPIGIPGEIVIGGHLGVSPGYIGKPELSAQKFVAHPLQNGKGNVYKTGDIGWWLPDGKLVCQGRMDSQIKIRGFRIELTEIESILLSAPGVNCAVVVSDESGPSHQLHAFVTCSENYCESQLTEYLNSELPLYSIPNTITCLDVFPLNQSGKVDKTMLLSKRSEKVLSNRKFQKPETDLEILMIGIWAEVLKLDSKTISTSDNFFSLGGNSLLIGQLVNILSACDHVTWKELNLSTTMLYAYPTIRKFCQALAERISNY